jgi:dinuclear metal center YbgI/SA1388 family protein
MLRDEFLQRLHELLDSDFVQDYGPNGLQVEGKTEVRRVVTGVTASLEFIERAAKRGADAVVVHHGIFWNHQSPVLKGSHLRRVRALLDAEMSLFAYHLPLDRHERVGNNAPALRALGATELTPFGFAKGSSVGWRGRFEIPLSPQELLTRVESYYGVKALAFLHGKPLIATLGMISGAAHGELTTAINEGLDAFLTGEVSEYNFHLAKEDRIHHLSVGHHASERVGPRELARWIHDELGLHAEFLDIPNPV